MEAIPKHIIESAANDDIAAFERIYKATHAYAYNIAFRMAGHKEDAEEITQEAFIKAHRSLKQFRFNSSLTTWIYRIVINTAINKIKQRNRRRENPLNLADHTPEAPVSRPFETAHHKEDRGELVRQMLESLSPKLRACVVLKDMEGLRYREIAETLNININTVRTRLKRAREILLRKASSKKAARHELF